MGTIFGENILSKINYSLTVLKDNNAFLIKEKYYTYDELAKCVSKIRNAIRNIKEDNIGLVANDDLETYASIIALWYEGKSYVPLHPNQPIGRCLEIINQVGMSYLLDSSPMSRYDINVIKTKELAFESYQLDYIDYSDDKIAYILFTSGSTGKPKGVMISRGNLGSFAQAFKKLGFDLNMNDRCLQMFDLTFDFSVETYLIPLLIGACQYTVPYNKVKFLAVYNLIDKYQLTFTSMVPSIIHYLMPYMDEIEAPFMRYSLFCGESLLLNETESWAKCIPNARIENVYGPTECTVFCTAYTYQNSKENKELNGIICIGKPMYNTQTIIINDSNEEVMVGEQGELCLASSQLSPGYWKNEIKNKTSFFIHKGIRYYRTGDLCSMDADGDIYYHGRVDFQVKIQGFRVELGEIESIARNKIGDSTNVIAIAISSSNGSNEIALCIEKEKEDVEALLKTLRMKLPPYMIPSVICCIPHFPINANGKIDRIKLIKIAEQNKK
jgi:D-alanine--poly(phosphoribitol) ligase subunit 1